jgi:hypothetical protein
VLALELTTNSAGFYPGFPTLTTAYLIGADGQKVGVTQQPYTADEENGVIYIVMDKLGYLGGSTPGTTLTISGIHIDTTLPESPYVVTSAALHVTLNFEDEGFVFDDPTPEPKTWFLLVAGSLSALIALRRRS